MMNGHSSCQSSSAWKLPLDTTIGSPARWNKVVRGAQPVAYLARPISGFRTAADQTSSPFRLFGPELLVMSVTRSFPQQAALG